MAAVWILFFVSCAMQGAGFALLNASLSAYRKSRKQSRGRVWEMDGTNRNLDGHDADGDSPDRRNTGAAEPLPAQPVAFPGHACFLLFGGALLMLVYALFLGHLLLLTGQSIFSVFMGIAVYKQYTLMRGK